MLNHFQTTDAGLAAVLSTCGVPAPVIDGKPYPAMMVYTLDHLRAFGFHDMPAFEAAHKARKEKRIGTRIFNFQQTEMLDQVLRGWKRAAVAHKENQSITLQDPNGEDVALWSFFFNEMRKLLLSHSEIPTFLAFVGNTSTSKQPIEANGRKFEGLEVAIQRGAFSIVSIDAPEEIRRQIRV